MNNELEFSSIEKIQEMGLKSEEFRNFLKSFNDEDVDFENLENVAEVYNDYEICIYDETLKIEDNLYMIQEGGFYFINGDLIVDGYIQGYGATILYVNGNIVANQILFANETYVEKNVIANEAYLVDTDLTIKIKGELKTKKIYSSINTGEIDINLLDTGIKGIIVRDSYDEMGDRDILEDLNLKEIIEDEEYEWHLTI
jgi:hypothetical protein